MAIQDTYDVVVVGAGNAALAASVAARDAGARRVLVLEKAPREQRGGNTLFSGGLLRFAFDTVDQLVAVVPEASSLPGFLDGIEAYPAQAFRADLQRVTQGLTDPELSDILIANSYETVRWMAGLGIPMEPAISLGAVKVGGVIKWPKGAIIRARHEGVGLSESWFRIAEQHGVDIRYGFGATGLLQGDDGRVAGVRARGEQGIENIAAGAVILACGGFEGNSAWRTQYLGKAWNHAKVRGSRYNQGDGLRIALDAGALPYGNWGGCHATPINALAPTYGQRELTDKTNRLSYPYGVMINRHGLRFVDEGEDQQFFTYAKFGGIILGQPEGLAYQIFDSKVVDLLEPRYSTSDPITADTLQALVEKLDVDCTVALKTLQGYNAACAGGHFDPGSLDGLCTDGLDLPKSNWAQKLDKPPFLAYPVTGGITFSFGGLKVDSAARVQGTDWNAIPGLYTCGEMVGGLFHYNYPGGSGLMSGAVFGRIAGSGAARFACGETH